MMCQPAAGRRPSLEIHIAISPTQTFLNMVRCFTHSLRLYGGRYRDAPVIVTTGDSKADHGLAGRLPWLEPNGIEIRWIPEAAFAADSYYATGTARFNHEFACDIVLALDSDILVAGPIDQLVTSVFEAQALAGLIAHVSPFVNRGKGWQDVYDACGLGPVRAVHQHTGWGVMGTDKRHRYCPPYFNFGVICAPASRIRALGPELLPLIHKVDDVLEHDHKAQIALALAIAHLDIPCLSLPMRYNMPNDPRLEDLHPGELPEARLLHLLRKHVVSKYEIFSSWDRLDEFLQRTDLLGTNERARQVLNTVRPWIRPTAPDVVQPGESR